MTTTGVVQTKKAAIASIAAELHAVMKVALGVSLAAKNAKVMSAQAGDKALGFHPITNFIDEIAQQAIQGVEEIDHHALKLSYITVTEERTRDAYRRFTSVVRNYADARYIESLKTNMQKVEEAMQEAQREYQMSIRKLFTLLEAINECMLSAQAIASVSRIVTANAGDYRSNLQVVADTLDQAAIFIKDKVSTSHNHLRHIDRIDRRQRAK